MNLDETFFKNQVHLVAGIYDKEQFDADREDS